MVEAFVGRDHELAALAALRERAVGGRRQLVMVTGGAGIGKTWLCERASEAAYRDGFDVAWGRCWPHGGAPALWPWPALLPTLAGPAGAGLLAADASRDRVDPERFARFTAVAELLAETRADKPTMIVIDDVHHADESALLLTRFLTGTLDRLPLVVVLARRTSPGEDGPAVLDELQRDATTIALRPFDLHDTAALLAAHGQPNPDRVAAETLLRVTGGVPLYLARAVHTGWTGSGPATVEHAIAGAIDRLAPAQRRILAFAALLGVDGAVGEVAGLAGEPPAVVLEALTAASGTGLAELTRAGYRFHDLVRQVALGQLGTAETLDAHARAAAMLARSGHVERVAHHALAAAVRSDADAEIAIAACRAAAESLRRGYAYEPAADLLNRAVALAGPADAELLVERADAVLDSGRLTDARAAFEAATEAAERAGDPVLLARAVLGLGGVWVHQYRNAAVRERVLARQRAALEALPDHERALRCRLAVRLAAEAVYEGKPVDGVLDALAQTWALGDPRALADSLSLTHHAVLGPEHAAMRLPLAEAQIAAASAAGDGILALFGLMWRTVDLYLLGDPRADRSLTELRQRTAALGVAAVGYIVACMDVMRLIRAGRLDEAEAAAGECLRLGLDVGDADATGYYGAQLLTIRWLQGRDAELAELVTGTVESASLAVGEYGFRASVVMVLARGGRLDEARAALEPLRAMGLVTLPKSSTWLAAMVGLAEAAAMLDDPDLAAEVADLLRPYADLPAMPSLGVSCLGSVSRALGRAALTAGDPASAVAYLEQAIAMNVRLEHRPATAVCRAELAEALVARGGPGDLERARTQLADAIDEARALGLWPRVDAWSVLANALTPSATPAVLRRRADGGWTLRGGDVPIELPDLVGVRYLGRLLERPGEDLPAVDLCDAGVLTGRQQLLDPAAVDAYRRRVTDLDTAIDDAEADADLARAERFRLEREAVAGELARAIGLGGRMREFTSSPERARTAVRKAIKRAVDAIAAADPVLGGELRTEITTGSVCRYTPGARRWRVEWKAP
ncbi:MAG TPA: AAA family ATPase [Actinophytocola sp.]|uniref:AAA family ATPase n=1 Tax=Actinophytocola sp. TaxID=1872138 RepID=UPI002DDCFF85|nr:AAA family ATPase [Actinophytocola sp.]HEV2783275.1 AAA family ATPase [Actinophytocola sp.]